MRLLIEALTKSYRNQDVCILKDLSLMIKEGEKAIILGLNGSGKTTLIKCILGLLTPDAGVIKINNSKNIKKQRIAMGFVPQYNGFDRRLSLKDNLIYHAKMYGFSRTAATGNLQRLGEEFGLTSFFESLPAALSGGTLRKAILVRALVTEPNIVILDEPTTNVDPPYRAVLHRHLANITAQGGAVMLSTHIRDDILESGNTSLYMLQDGALSTASRQTVEAFFNTEGKVDEQWKK